MHRTKWDMESIDIQAHAAGHATSQDSMPVKLGILGRAERERLFHSITHAAVRRDKAV